MPRETNMALNKWRHSKMIPLVDCAHDAVYRRAGLSLPSWRSSFVSIHAKKSISFLKWRRKIYFFLYWYSIDRRNEIARKRHNRPKIKIEVCHSHRRTNPTTKYLIHLTFSHCISNNNNDNRDIDTRKTIQPIQLTLSHSLSLSSPPPKKNENNKKSGAVRCRQCRRHILPHATSELWMKWKFCSFFRSHKIHCQLSSFFITFFPFFFVLLV